MVQVSILWYRSRSNSVCLRRPENCQIVVLAIPHARAMVASSLRAKSRAGIIRRHCVRCSPFVVAMHDGLWTALSAFLTVTQSRAKLVASIDLRSKNYLLQGANLGNFSRCAGFPRTLMILIETLAVLMTRCSRSGAAAAACRRHGFGTFGNSSPDFFSPLHSCSLLGVHAPFSPHTISSLR